MSAPAQFGPVQTAFPDAEFWEEGGQPYVFLPELRFVGAGKRKKMQALLCPSPRDSYTTRLFLEEQIPERVQNWKQVTIRGRTWWACSWNNVPASLPWLEILANHLRPLQ